MTGGVELPSQPFQSTYSDCRTIEIPTGLDRDVRKRFVSRVNEAVAKQIELSRTFDAVRELAGDVREEGERLVISHERAAAAARGASVNALNSSGCGPNCRKRSPVR